MSSSANRPDYSGVTETPGTLVSREAASMAVSRYEIVRPLAAGRRALEVACGSGQGLRYVGRDAGWIVGGDIAPGLLASAQRHYQGAVPLVQFDAHDLPFANASFDVIQIHEAIYYMVKPVRVFEECRRVLREGGVLVLSSINPEWADFNASPHATGYFNARELRSALANVFGSVEILFGFPVARRTLLGFTVSLIKRTAVRLKLIPQTMTGKAFLKRLFLGPLVAVPAELTSQWAPIDRPIGAPAHESPRFRIIYAIARI